MNDTQLAYRREGEGVALVLVHGYLGAADMWNNQIAHFASRFDVIAPDLAGFGNSNHLQAPESIAGHAESVLRLLNALEIDRFYLLGHSIGGMIVQQIAASAIGRVAKLVLYGTGPVGVLPDRFETIEQSRQRLQRDGLAAAAKRIAATWFVQGEAAAGYKVCERIARHTTMQAALASLSAWERWDGSGALAGIAAPTLVLWGDRDRSYGWPQPEALWRGIPDSSLAVVSGCAHNVHMEKPDLFNRIVSDFLA